MKRQDWLPIGLPGDVQLLRSMLMFEKRFGSKDVADVIERKIKRITDEQHKETPCTRTKQQENQVNQVTETAQTA